MWQAIIVSFSAFISLACVDASQDTAIPVGASQVTKQNQPVPTLDHAAIGNLFYKSDLQKLRIRRSHMFVTDISVGTPPQPFKCLVDSGSADLWIPSRRCKSCENTHHFHADVSSSFMPAVARTPTGLMPVPVRMAYSRYQGQGHGEVVGFLVQDTVRFGTTTIANQSFLIVEEAKLPKHRSWDGICGIGWKQMSSAKTGQPLYRNFKPMYENLEASGTALVTLVPSRTFQAGTHAFIVTGQLPLAACKPGTLGWLEAEAVNPKEDVELSFWAASASWYVEKPDAFSVTEIPMRFLLDTASPFILAPPGEFFGIARSLFPPGVFDKECGLDQWADNQVICLCETAKKMYPLRLRIADHSYDITSEMLFKRAPAKNGGELCLLMLQENPMTSADPLELLGDLLGGTHGLATRIPVTAPFKIPESFFFVPMANGMTGVEEEKVQTMPDGSVCTSRLLWFNGTLKKNDTTCRPRETMPGRRLDAPAGVENMWVLGAPFMEHFVVVLDYAHARLGVAEVAKTGNGAVARVVAANTEGLGDRVETGRVQDRSWDSAPRHHVTAHQSPEHAQHNAAWTAFALVAIVVALCGGTVAHYTRKLRRRKNFLTPIGSEETGINAQDASEPDPFAAE